MAQCLSFKPRSDILTNKIKFEAIGGVCSKAGKIWLSESK